MKENGIDVTSIPPMRLGESNQPDLVVVTNAVRKGVRLQRAIQAKDGHWPAENAGPMFFTPPLVSMYADKLLYKLSWMISYISFKHEYIILRLSCLISVCNVDYV